SATGSMRRASATAAPPLLRVRGLEKRFGEHVVLRGIDLTVGRGQVVALIGGSGSGKTTILRLIGGQLRPQQGKVIFDGQDIHRLDRAGLYAVRRRMGMLYQFGALFTDMTAFQNVAFPLREHTDLPEAMVRDLVLLKLNAVGLRGAARFHTSQLSGGMARRVALARAIALDPALIMYDEPFAGLGSGEIADLSALIRRIHAETGLTVLLIEHKLHEFMKLVHRVIALDFGEVIADDLPERIVEHPRVIEAYIGGGASGTEAA
ncbi:MAG: ABC transporter ATP-binding protein, partial [Gammaproteobacteria bacterium]